jgi:hypothetical protein
VHVAQATRANVFRCWRFGVAGQPKNHGRAAVQAGKDKRPAHVHFELQAGFLTFDCFNLVVVGLPRAPFARHILGRHVVDFAAQPRAPIAGVDFGARHQLQEEVGAGLLVLSLDAKARSEVAQAVEHAKNLAHGVRP